MSMRTLASYSHLAHPVRMSQFTAEALAPTPNGTRYAEQMCKHFRHKAEAVFENGAGAVDFKFATATLTPTPEGLRLACAAGDLIGLARAKYVLEDHLLRFAFRENLPRLDWSGPETPAPPAPPGARPPKPAGA